MTDLQKQLEEQLKLIGNIKIIAPLRAIFDGIERQNRRIEELTAEGAKLREALSECERLARTAHEGFSEDAMRCVSFIEQIAHGALNPDSDRHEIGPPEGFGSNRSDVPQAGEYGSGDSGGPTDSDGQSACPCGDPTHCGTAADRQRCKFCGSDLVDAQCDSCGCIQNCEHDWRYEKSAARGLILHCKRCGEIMPPADDRRDSDDEGQENES